MKTAPEAGTSASRAATELLYRPLEFVMVRAPLLPVERYHALDTREDPLSLLADPHVRRALAVGSPSLLNTVERFRQSKPSRRDAEQTGAKLLRYVTRMSTRPTPYGLFAGVALGTWSRVTDLTIRSTCAVTKTRPDMAWLMALVMSAEANSSIRKRLNTWANPLAVIEAGRLALTERVPTGKGAPGLPVSVRATGAVKRAMSLARRPVPYEELAARLCETTPSATPEKVELLLKDLWEQTFLLTDLRPPLLYDSPARYVAERLADIPEAADELARLNALLTAASAWDRLEPEGSAEAFLALLVQAGGKADGSGETPVQVDMAMKVEGGLGERVAVEAARACELLLQLSPSPRGASSLAGYRQAFLNHYGHEREVPLLELLNPNVGLGPPSLHGHAPTGPDSQKAALRSQTLLQIACSALRDRERVVHLDEKRLARLETWRPDAQTAPISLDINILVAARSAAAIDSGDFTVVLGPNLGALAAGRNLGRFADLIGPDGHKALEQAATAEQTHAPDELWAELVHLPSNLRSANVVIRPPVRAYEVALGVTAAAPASHVIPLDELLVGVEDGRFCVRWPEAGKRVRFCTGHMLNLYTAPSVGRFLAELSLDGKALFSTFDWGPVESFPYLPRVQAGRIVLRLAQWRIQKEDLEIEPSHGFRQSLDCWRARWDVPRQVFLSVGDNRLVLDLDQDSQSAELRAELVKLTAGGSLIVQEVVPSLDEAWLSGPGGHYYSEFIVSLVLRSDLRQATPPTVTDVEGAATSAPPAADPAAQLAGPLQRTYPPGSEWLFVKLYGPRGLEDDVISGSMLTLAENLITSGLADSWFFIRYADPNPHIRLRFRGSPERLTGQVFGHVCDWAGRLITDGLCQKFVFDTYEREVERFGGPAGAAAAESLFFVDSRYAAQLVHSTGSRTQWPHDHKTLVAVSIDDLLGAIGFTEEARLRWYRGQAKLGGTDAGSEYRQRKTVLRSLLGRPEALANEPGGADIAGLFQARRSALAPVSDCLRQLANRGELGQSLDKLSASFVHLHVNRMGGLDPSSEQRILSLLLRTREGLEKSPTVRPIP
jgi:thiopeptide-type bacteriocin biosynthesis protein